MALRQDDVPFSLVGFQTVVLSEATFQHLPARAMAVLDDLQKRGVIEITHGLSDSRGRKRPSPLSEAETEQRLRDLTTNLRG